MAKPQRQKAPQHKKPHHISKKASGKPSKQSSKSHNKKGQNNEQLDDVMAWGKSKENYYQEQQNQYSELSEEQDQAKQIYENQYQNNLNQDQFYDLPSEKEQKEEDDQQEEDEEAFINDQYVEGQILWATSLAKLFSTVQDQKAEFRKKVYDSYLLILMSLKQFKIPYADQHPLVQNLPMLKKALQHFQKQIPKLQQKLMQDYEGDEIQEQQMDNEDQQDQEQDGSMDQNEQQNLDYLDYSPQQTKSKSHSKLESKNISQGLQIYEKIKQQKQQQRKAKKQLNKKTRQQNLPKQAFKLVGENQARLANQKILKNKGLMKRRQRGDGNSRTKLRGKFQKAIIRRRAKGIIGVKENPGRFYQGEDKVLYGKIASTKLK